MKERSAFKTIADVERAYGPPGPDRLRRIRLTTLPKDARGACNQWVEARALSGWTSVAAWAERHATESDLYFWCVGWAGSAVVNIRDTDLADLLRPYPAVMQVLRYDYGLDKYVPPPEPFEFARNEALYGAYDEEVGF